MEPVDVYRELARQLDAQRFVARFPHPFLLKHPVTLAATSGPSPADWDEHPAFATRTLRVEPDLEADLLDEQGPIAAEFRVAAVRKREGNPYPERISVGRARNCDVVLRFKSVSKLHAHLLPAPGPGGRTMELADAHSTNGTCLNGRTLKPHERAVVSVGDLIRFGVLEVRFMDAATLYRMLRVT